VDSLYKEFGRALRKARTDVGLTQKQVAERVGLTRTSITNIERGSQHIALHQLYQLASVLGLGPVALLPNQNVALDELLPPDALKLIAEDKEGQDFAVRVLGKSASVRGQQDVSVDR
jgi:transcriptional regulator with XRE-family HTH domain